MVKISETEEEMEKKYFIKKLDTELTAEDKEEVEELKAGAELIARASDILLSGYIDKNDIYNTVYQQLWNIQNILEDMAKEINPLIEKYREIWLSEREKNHEQE